MPAKKYHSKIWLRKRYIIEKKTIKDIAEECGVSEMTISRYLATFQIKKR